MLKSEYQKNNVGLVNADRMQENETTYNEIRNAIILQTVQDLKNDMRKIARNMKDNQYRMGKHVLCDVLSIFDFVRGKWYESLISIDGAYLVEQTIKEFNEDQKAAGGKEINIENLIQLLLFYREEMDRIEHIYTEQIKSACQKIKKLQEYHESRKDDSEYSNGAYSICETVINFLDSSGK